MLEFCFDTEQTPPRRMHRFHASTRQPGKLGLVLTAMIPAACASAQYGATEANLAHARNQSPRGSGLFEAQCASCHGARGESAGGAPRILGPGALPAYPQERNPNIGPSAGDPESLRLQAQSRPAGAPWRDPFRTARDLFTYVSEHMPLPKEKAGLLAADDYWAIVNFMLHAHGAEVPPQGVTPDNAGSVEL